VIPIGSASIPPEILLTGYDPAMFLWRWISLVFTVGIVASVWVYRFALGWVMGGHCRYQPTCSQYMLDSVAKYGPWRGAWRGLKRICRCHPWGGSGYDPP